MIGVIVTGGRDFTNRLVVYAALNSLHATYGVRQVVEGGARGADALAREWAKERGIPCITCPANWEKHGQAAGMIRNIEMLTDFPEHQIAAFPGGKGTAGMVREAEKRRRTITHFPDDPRTKKN